MILGNIEVFGSEMELLVIEIQKGGKFNLKLEHFCDIIASIMAEFMS